MVEAVPTSIVLLVDRDGPSLDGLWARLERCLDAGHALVDVVVAIGDRAPATHAALVAARHGEPRLEIVPLSHWFDGAAAVQRALPMTRGEIVVTMRPDDLVDLGQLTALLEALDGADAAVLAAPPAGGPTASLADRFTRRIFDVPFSVVSASLRAHRRQALQRIGDRSVPLALQPLLLAWQGGRIATISPPGTCRRRPPFARALRHALAAPLLYFLLSFTRRPLHLFGLAGCAAGVAGLAITLPLIADRLIHGVALADEPALIPGLLLCAMGVQSAAIGLLAELLVFARAHSFQEDASASIAE